MTASETPSETAAVQPASVTPPPNWMDQDELLKELWLKNETPENIASQLGRSIAAIMTRAARLGLPRRAAPGRKPGYQRKQAVVKNRPVSRDSSSERSYQTDGTVVENVKMMRICLMCLNRFPSEGRHNRICPSCKGTAEYAAGSSIPDIFKVDA